MDHGIAYEHDPLYQRLFGTSMDSVAWQLKNRGYTVGIYPKEVRAVWGGATRLDLKFDSAGLCDRISIAEAGQLFKEVFRRPHKLRRI